MKKLCTLILAVLAITSAWAAPGESFFRKAAKTVWAVDDPAFNPATPIPDSIAAKASAVIIARRIDIRAGLTEQNTIYSSSGRMLKSYRTYIDRVMVRILDPQALDDLSTFTFGQSSTTRTAFYTVSSAQRAFGARIHKPDGTVTDVDVSEAYRVTDGRKADDDRERVIAIPGLDTGDVLEYFTLTERTSREVSLPALTVTFNDRYPTLSYHLTGTFHPGLTVEYRTYNDAPLPAHGTDRRGHNTIDLTLTALPARENVRYTNEARQYPRIIINTLNNESKGAYVPSTARAPGLRANIPTGTCYRDIANIYHDIKFESKAIGRATSLVKSFIKDNPSASPRRIADHAWLALAYHVAIDPDESVDDFIMSLYFDRLLTNLKIFDTAGLGLGFINPRTDVPTEQMASWRHPSYVAYVADSVYSTEGLLYCQPGEMPPSFHGEKGGAYTGDPTKLNMRSVPTIFDIPKSTPRQNELRHTATLTLDPDMQHIHLQRTVKASGAAKAPFADLTTMAEWIADTEQYLGIDPSKRYKNRKADPVARRAELDQYMIDEATATLGTAPASVDSYEITSRGFIPGSPDITFTSQCTLDGLIADGGGDLLIAVGRLFGNRPQATPDEPARLTDAHLPATTMQRYRLDITIPVGFQATDDALAALASNTSNLVGQVVTRATRNDNTNTVSIDMMYRINHTVVSTDYNDQLLAIDNAAANFTTTHLILTKQ